MSEFDHEIPPVLPPKPAPLGAPRSPLYARLLNVIAMPGAVFEEVRTSRHAVGNWLLPLPLYALSLAVFVVVFFSIPSVQKLWNEQQTKMRALQSTQLTEAVKAGKIKQAEADQSLAAMDSLCQPRVVKSIAMAGGFFFGLFRVFWWALLLWFLARTVLRTPVSLGKALEVAGLASVVALLGNIAVVALTVDFGKSFSSGGFALTVGDFASTSHQMLVAVAQNAVNFWLIAVLGIGLARLTEAPWVRATFLVVTYWIASEFLLLVLGVGLA